MQMSVFAHIYCLTILSEEQIAFETLLTLDLV